MDNKSKLFLSTILIGIVGTATGCQQDEWNQLISKGKKEAEIGQYELAKADITAAMFLVDKPGGDQSRLIESLNNLAKQNQELSQSAEAETLWRRALAITQTEGKNGKLQAANILWELSWALDSQNRKSESRKARLQALATWQSLPGPYPSHAEICMNGVAHDYAEIGQYSKAEQIYKQSMSNRNWGGLCTHSGPYGDLGDLNSLGELAAKQKKFTEAAEYFKRTSGQLSAEIGKQQKQLPLIDPDTHRAADMYCRAGNFQAAVELYTHALKTMHTGQVSQHKSEFSCLYSLALLYDLQGQFDKARPLYEFCFAEGIKIDNKFPLYTPEEFSRAMLFLQETNQTSKQEELIEHNLLVCEKVLGSSHALTTMYLYAQDSLYEEQGRLQQCLKIREQIVNNNQKNYGAKGSRTCSSILQLGQLNLKMGNLSEAQRDLEQALELDKEGVKGFYNGSAIRWGLVDLYTK